MRFQAVSQGPDHLAVQAQGEKNQAARQLREHQQHARLGLGGRIDGLGKAEPGIQAEDLRRQQKGFQDERHPQAYGDSHGDFRQHPQQQARARPARAASTRGQSGNSASVIVNDRTMRARRGPL